MPIELVGADGITTPGMESGAMPTVGGDAVVESGSNSDGEWVRWADGTQQCRMIKNIDLSSIAFQSSPYPVLFVNDDISLSAGFESNPSTGTDSGWWNRLHQVVAALPTGNRLSTFAVLFRAGSFAADTIAGDVYVTAHGRWK